MRKPFAIALSLALLLCLAACGSPPTAQVHTFTDIIGVWFTEELPEDSLCADPDTLRVGRTWDGKDIFTLLRVQLDGALRAGDVREAWLRLKILENNGGSALRAGPITGAWEEGVTRGRARVLADIPKPLRQALAADDWLLIDVTDFVKDWLGGQGNHGLALFEANDSTETVFAATGENEPRLELLIAR